jgi:hypothetical protein
MAPMLACRAFGEDYNICATISTHARHGRVGARGHVARVGYLEAGVATGGREMLT